MKRGDVVRTGEELLALPVGSEVVDMDARRFKTVDKGAFPCDALGLARVVYPALVRVVGPVEPEWLRTAALAAASALPLASLADEAWGRAAKAAVAAADKARGIVNSREEFDALPAGTAVVERDWSAPARFAIKHKNTTTAPSSYPCFVIESRT